MEAISEGGSSLVTSAASCEEGKALLSADEEVYIEP